MTWLRDENLISPIREANGSEFYSVEFDIVVSVHKMNFRWEIRWSQGKRSKVVAMQQVSITAAFAPGMK